ncbi:hypothetical protein FXO38_18738 [Capsicum annuum]|nr:hypothetical protein FXO38_18738 [Capsicum annuum]KAF3661953.1 hypothetical protein FXO37_12695 [Capsicum annuum]
MGEESIPSATLSKLGSALNLYLSSSLECAACGGSSPVSAFSGNLEDPKVGPSSPGSSNLPTNADSGELSLHVAPEKIALFLDQSLKLLGEDPIMTSIKRCEKEKDDKIGQNDGVEFSSISGRDSPRIIAEKRVSQLSLDASEDFTAMEALVETKDSLSHILGIQSKDKFGKYLGFLVFHKKPCNRDFQFILDNLNTKLAGWKTKFLNMAGRIILTKSSLASIPAHVMSKLKRLRNPEVKHSYREQNGVADALAKDGARASGFQETTLFEVPPICAKDAV